MHNFEILSVYHDMPGISPCILKILTLNLSVKKSASKRMLRDDIGKILERH